MNERSAQRANPLETRKLRKKTHKYNGEVSVIVIVYSSILIYVYIVGCLNFLTCSQLGLKIPSHCFNWLIIWFKDPTPLHYWPDLCRSHWHFIG